MQRLKYNCGMAKGSIKRSAFRISFAVIVITAIPWLTWLAIRDAGAQRAVLLRDGTIIYFERVLGGTNAIYMDRVWQKWAKKIFPKESEAWISPGFPYKTSRSKNKDALIINLVCKDSNYDEGWEEVDAIDDNGFVYVNGCQNTGQMEIDLFPRRQKKFQLRLYRTKFFSEDYVEFTVPNPLWQEKFPEWQPESLPTTKTNGPVSVTILGLKTNSTEIGQPPFAPRWRAELQIESSDGVWGSQPMLWLTNEFPNSLLAECHQAFGWLSDATGNHGDYLSPKENAWKYRLRLFHCARSLASNEVWTIPNIVVPQILSLKRFYNLSGEINGSKLYVPAICGPGTLVISNGVDFRIQAPVSNSPGNSGGGFSYGDDSMRYTLAWRGFDTPFVVVDTSDLGEGATLQLQVVDQTGKVWQTTTGEHFDNYSDSIRGWMTRKVFRIRAPVGETVNLRFFLIRGRDFEFTIKPPEFTASTKP